MSDLRLTGHTNKTWYIATSTSLDKVVAWYSDASSGECVTANESTWDGFTCYLTEAEWVSDLTDLGEDVPENYEFE